MPTTSAFLEAVLAAPNFSARSKRLARRKAEFSAAGVEALISRANAQMRQAPREACELARLALRMAEAMDDDALRLACLRAWAQAGTLGGDYRSALRAADGSLEVYTRMASGPDATEQPAILEAELLSVRVQILTHLERYEDAKESGRRALRAFEAVDSVKGVFRARMALAELAYRVDKPREALRQYARVEKILPAGASPRVRGLLAANRANALQSCNRYRAAVRWFETARGIFEADGCAHTVAQIDYNMAYSSMLRGLYDDALQRYARVEKEFTKLDDDRHLAHVDLDRAEIFLILNQPQDARSSAQRASERFTKTGVGKEKAQAEYFAGRAADLCGQGEAAVASYEKAEAGFRSLGLATPQISCLVQRSHLARRMRQLDEAATLVARAESLLTDKTNPLTVASVELCRANLHLDGGRANEGLYTADSALMRCRHVHAPWLHIEANRIIGRANVVRGQSDQALLAFRTAIDELERYRGGVPPDEYMTSFMAARSSLYGDIVDLLVVRGDADLAFEFAERAKSRALVDLLAGREAGGEAAPRPPRRLRYLREKLNTIYQRLFRPGELKVVPAMRGASSSHGEAADIEAEIARVLRTRRQEDSEGTSLFTVDAPTLDSIQADLEEDATLIEYFLTENRLFTFVVTKDSVDVVRKVVDPNEIEGALQRFRFHLAKFERQTVVAEDLVLKATRDNLGKLKELLLDPIKEHLTSDDGKTAARLIVIPHGPLHSLPFHALPWGAKWVADHFEVVYAPSAAVYRYCAKRGERATGPSAVFGVPDADTPRIADESRQVASLLKTDRLYLGDEATFDTLHAVAADAKVLHVATHGTFNRSQPMLSAIKMGKNWVTLYDLYTLDIRGELVVMSTCESGTASVSGGDEVLGLTRGCLYAGAPALLSTQWRIQDAVAEAFMSAFYESLATLPDAAAAQKAAMASVREKYPHPYHWAPFFLTGRPIRKDVAPALQSSASVEDSTPQLVGSAT